jgi:phosphoglycolate phosphatase-like HAD superfamily hydrolase
MTTLILFDIDGTLTATCESDARCFVTAFDRIFGLPCPSTDWHTYEHVTDSGIVDEILLKARGKGVTHQELETFSLAYVDEMKSDHAKHPNDYQEIPGARRLLDALSRESGLRPIALATGCMRRSAMFKLSCAGIDAAAVPGGFADDAMTRAGIAQTAVARSNAQPDDIVYVGDGVWDVVTSADLGFRFIGITKQSCADSLRQYGASVVLDDYRDLEGFYEALQKATVPPRQ